jgi:hypothetical protein
MSLVGSYLKSRREKGAILSLRLVEHRDMWRDALLLDQPVQHWSRPLAYGQHDAFDLQRKFSLPLICIRDQSGSGIVLDFGLMVLTAGGPGWQSNG